MSCLIPILGLVFGGMELNEAGQDASGYSPQGAVAELHDLGLLARLRDPRVQPDSFSSYDRSGGNNDGFNGTYSRLRMEGNDSVLAEAAGPGIIQRIWFTHTSGERPGLLDGKQEHIKIYLNQAVVPAIDVPLESIFSGQLPGFPRPLVSEGTGGYVSYVPIPFQNGCKVVVEGKGVRFYQINLSTLPPGTTVSTFTHPPDTSRQRDLDRAVQLWTHPEAFADEAEPSVDLARYAVNSLGNSELRYALKGGPATVQSFAIRPTAGFEDAWRAARLRITWDGNRAGPAVEVPIGHFFGWSRGAISYRSLLAGDHEGVWYNRFPMPYRREAILTIDSERALKGTIEVRTRAGVVPDAAYFRATHQQAAAPPGQDFVWLKERGRGHFAGVFLMTEAKAKLPYWLEGDDRFRVDGRLAIHGTGSEDYFNCGWYALPGRLDRPGCYPQHGFPVYQQEGELWRAAAYRWHLADPVPFNRSIEAGIEHGGDNTFPANYHAVVYWYSEAPGPDGSAR